MNKYDYTSHAANGEVRSSTSLGDNTEAISLSSLCNFSGGVGLYEEEEIESEQRKALMGPVSPLCQDPWWARVGRVCSGHRLSFWVLPQMPDCALR